MGKVVVSEFISLDGVIEDPGGSEGTEFGGWTFTFPNDGGMAFKGEELEAADVQLLGRVTYEGFSAAWPAMEEETGAFGRKMNAMPKVVVSTTLTDPTWNATVDDGGDLAKTVASLKEQYDGDILVAGSATLAKALQELGLVDEYRLMVFATLLGKGKRLFSDNASMQQFSLAEQRECGPDVQLLIYRRNDGG
jgi:dihydrofolate reductase